MLYLRTHITDLSQEELSSMMQSLPAQRREQAKRFKFVQGQKECTLAYLELCRGLREEYGITTMPEFGYGEHGKPFLTTYPHIHFSLSHCREAAGCLLSTQPCGMDVERIRSYDPSLIRYTMNEEEADRILSSSRPEVMFIRLWTQKEAVLKLRGTGITDNIKEVLNDLHDIRLHTTEHLDEGFVCSCATTEQI